ncbi:MAG: aminotransferase class IV family protein [Dokdonella sp.]
MTAYRIELNGAPAGVDELRAIALVNYGHFTSMQVHEGGVRGLDLQLRRLDHATRELFGCPLDVEQTRRWMRGAVLGSGPALSLRVNVFSRVLDRDRLDAAAAPDVLVTTGAARSIKPLALRVRSVHYERELPHIKHVGTFGLFHQKRLAQLHGFDDALFVDVAGAISEGAIWNVGFFDGERFVWPDAPALDGVSMQLLKRGMLARGIESVTRRIGIADIGALRSAFFTNSSSTAVPIASIDSTRFVVDQRVRDTLDDCMTSNPFQRI